MHKSIRNSLRLLFLLVVVIVLGAVVLLSYGLIIKSQAEALLKDLTAIKVGLSTGTEANLFAQKHQGLLFQVSEPCNSDSCSRIFRLQNTWLSTSRLEPLAEFRVNISVKNGTVDSIGAFLFRAMPISPTFDASAGVVDEYVELPRHGHYYFPTPVGKPYLKVVLDSHADPVQRQHAFAFSFRCLVKPGGCDLPCDYLPFAWQDWKIHLQQASFAGDFNSYYPKGGRCKP